MKRGLVSALFAAASVLLLQTAAWSLEVGTKAPDFKLKNLAGEKIRLSDYKGQIILLKLATTWCPTCKQQLQEVQEIGEFLRENKIAFVEVFVQDTEAMIRDYLQGVSLPMTHATVIDNGQALKAYNVYVIPRVLVIGPDFKIRRDGSLITAADLKKIVLDVLAEK